MTNFSVYLFLHYKYALPAFFSGIICDLKQRQSINEWQQAEIEMKQLALLS